MPGLQCDWIICQSFNVLPYWPRTTSSIDTSMHTGDGIMLISRWSTCCNKSAVRADKDQQRCEAIREHFETWGEDNICWSKRSDSQRKGWEAWRLKRVDPISDNDSVFISLPLNWRWRRRSDVKYWNRRMQIQILGDDPAARRWKLPSKTSVAADLEQTVKLKCSCNIKKSSIDNGVYAYFELGSCLNSY